VARWRWVVALLCVASGARAAGRTTVDSGAARGWVREAMDAMGGENALRGVHGLHMVGVHHLAGVAYSPHLTEPRMTYELVDEWRDVDHHRFSRRATAYAPNFRDGLRYRLVADPVERVAIIEAERFGSFPADSSGVEEYTRELALAPERMLTNAMAASDLEARRDTVIAGQRYHVVAFAHGQVTVCIHTITHLPLAVETRVAVDDPDWTVWGDIVSRTTFSSWSRAHEGVHLPLTRTTTRNGIPYETWSLTTLDVVASVPADSFVIPDSLRQRGLHQPTLALDTGHVVADGVVFLPAIWNVLLVRQPDGVVVIEPPHSPRYSRLVIAEAARRFPDIPIKAVIATDFMWSHYAGIREYIARGVPVYTPDANVADLRRILAAPHQLVPDSLARAPRPARITGVASRLTIGTGSNRIELLSAIGPGTDYGEHMLVAYLPDQRLLYASDLLPTPAFEPNFVGQGTVDVAALVARERLSVDSVVTIHIAPRAWAPIADSVQTGY
jgi:hypothetical protein